MAKFKVLIRVLHNGKFFEEGEDIELTSEEADPLLLLHVVEPLPTPKAKAKGE